MRPIQVDRRTFLQNLRQSGLLSERAFREAVEQLPESNRGRAVARSLVKLGVLTRFQAELLLVGRTSGFFVGPYKILEQVGQGGMGRVYKAIHLTMNRTVALKVLTPQLMKTQKAQKLFRREVQAAAHLNHPNIVTAYDANEIEGRHFLAMEYVDGPNLDQLVRSRAQLKVGLACEIIRQAALGLQCAHEHGMVHRDIKPANLLLQRSRNKKSFVVKILDFGLARLHEPTAAVPAGTIITKEHRVMGTPDYLSPEQARDLHQLDIRSDIYSLGCTFYTLLTGQAPFPGGSTLEKLIRHNSEEPDSVSGFRQDVPDGVIEVLRKMMAKEPADRFQTPAEVASALMSFAPGAVQSDSSTHPALAGDSEDLPGTGSSGELAIGTLPADMSVTPVNISGEGPILPWQGMKKEIHRFSRKALILFIGVLAGLLGGLLFALSLLD